MAGGEVHVSFAASSQTPSVQRIMPKCSETAVGLELGVGPNSRPTAVSEHFLSDDHTPNDMELIPLELIHSSRDSIRKAREVYLIERGQTLEPKGINKREEM